MTILNFSQRDKISTYVTDKNQNKNHQNKLKKDKMQIYFDGPFQKRIWRGPSVDRNIFTFHLFLGDFYVIPPIISLSPSSLKMKICITV